MTDEVSHNIEQLVFCVCLFDAASNIREEFLTFVKPHRITGEHLAHEIIQLLGGQVYTFTIAKQQMAWIQVIMDPGCHFLLEILRA